MIAMWAETHKYDMKVYREELFRLSNRLRTLAGREFLHAALDRIPVWSGAAQATLLPLARALRQVQFVHITPKVNRTGKTRGIEAGKAHGTALMVPATIGAVNKGATDGKYVMEWRHNLFHLWLLSNYHVSTADSDTPWDVVKHGGDAAWAYYEKYAKPFLPSPFDARVVKKKTIRVI